MNNENVVRDEVVAVKLKVKKNFGKKFNYQSNHKRSQYQGNKEHTKSCFKCGKRF